MNGSKRKRRVDGHGWLRDDNGNVTPEAEVFLRSCGFFMDANDLASSVIDHHGKMRKIDWFEQHMPRRSNERGVMNYVLPKDLHHIIHSYYYNPICFLWNVILNVSEFDGLYGYFTFFTSVPGGMQLEPQQIETALKPTDGVDLGTALRRRTFICNVENAECLSDLSCTFQPISMGRVCMNATTITPRDFNFSQIPSLESNEMKFDIKENTRKIYCTEGYTDKIEIELPWTWNLPTPCVRLTRFLTETMRPIFHQTLERASTSQRKETPESQAVLRVLRFVVDLSPLNCFQSMVAGKFLPVLQSLKSAVQPRTLFRVPISISTDSDSDSESNVTRMDPNDLEVFRHCFGPLQAWLAHLGEHCEQIFYNPPNNE